VIDDQNRFVNDLEMKLKVLLPSREDRTVQLDQTAPGRYSGLFPANETGEYYLNLTGKGEEGFSQSRVFGYGIPHTEEFSSRGVNYDFLEKLAAITGGKVTDLKGDPKRRFRVESEGKKHGNPLWPHMTIVALLILILDVVIRKLHGIRRFLFSG